MILLQILAGWFVADLISGVFHWWVDRADEKTFLFPHLVRDFQSHHKDPALMLKSNMLRLSAEPLVASLIGYAIALYFWPAFFVSMSLGGGLTQVAHRYSHVMRPHWFIRILQQTRLFITSDVHSKHHTDFTRNFCILCGWANPLLNLFMRKSI